MTVSMSTNLAQMDSFVSNVNKSIGGIDQLNNSLDRSSSKLGDLAESAKNFIGSFLNMDTIKNGIQKTIEEAAKMQSQIISVQGMLGNKEAGSAYFDHLQKQANQSGFAFEDLQNNARNFIGITKNTDSLDKLGNLSERLFLGNQSKGLDDAGGAIKEMMSGNGDSLKADFGFNDQDIGILKASKDMDDFTAKFDGILNQKGLNSSMLDGFNNSATAQFDNLKSNIATSFGRVGEGALESLTPVLSRLNQIFESSGFQGFINGLSKGLLWISNLIVSLVNWIEWVGNIIQSNWGIIAPIIWGIVAALIVYNASLLINSIQTGENIIAKGLHAIASWAETAAIIALTIAQDGLNAALAMCPITWIIVAIIILIAIFYAAVGAVNEFAGTSYSATGLIAGFFAALAATIYNAIALVWNVSAAYAEFLINLFTNPTEAVKRLFLNLALAIIDAMLAATRGCDQFATNFANAIIAGINTGIRSWNNFVDILNSFGGLGDKFGLGKGKEFSYTASITSNFDDAKAMIQKYLNTTPDNYTKVARMGSLDIGSAFNSGYGAGSGVEKSMSDLFNVNNKVPDLNSWNQAQGQGTLPMDNMGDTSGLQFGSDNSDISKNIAQGAESLNNMNDNLDVSNEHLEMLRDLAEQDSIQNFVSLTPTVQVTTGDIRQEADVNTIISHIETYMETELTNSAEGLYA